MNAQTFTLTFDVLLLAAGFTFLAQAFGIPAAIGLSLLAIFVK